jgi:hypothetical protein
MKKRALRIDRPFEKWTYFSCPLLNSGTLDPNGTFCEKSIYSIMERNTFFLEIFDSIRFFGFSPLSFNIRYWDFFVLGRYGF